MSQGVPFGAFPQTPFAFSFSVHEVSGAVPDLYHDARFFSDSSAFLEAGVGFPFSPILFEPSLPFRVLLFFPFSGQEVTARISVPVPVGRKA